MYNMFLQLEADEASHHTSQEDNDVAGKASEHAMDRDDVTSIAAVHGAEADLNGEQVQ